MNVKDVLKNVCVYLGKEELLESIYFENDGEALIDEQTKDLNRMLKCLNLTISEIASDYLPITREKEITLEQYKIDLSDIDSNIQEIIGIKTLMGKSIKYKIVDNKVICFANKVVVTYKVYPSEMLLDGTCENFGGRLSERVIAYGVASEYCYLNMVYDDATIWENRFKNALFVESRKKGEIKLKKRGWF